MRDLVLDGQTMRQDLSEILERLYMLLMSSAFEFGLMV